MKSPPNKRGNSFAGIIGGRLSFKAANSVDKFSCDMYIYLLPSQELKVNEKWPYSLSAEYGHSGLFLIKSDDAQKELGSPEDVPQMAMYRQQKISAIPPLSHHHHHHHHHLEKTHHLEFHVNTSHLRGRAEADCHDSWRANQVYSNMDLAVCA